MRTDIDFTALGHLDEFVLLAVRSTLTVARSAAIDQFIVAVL